MWPISNLRTFVKTRPPLVIFMLCLCAFGLILLSLAYFIENNELRDPDLSNDWNTFLKSFSQLRFCLAESPMMNDISLLSPKLDLKLGGLGEMDIKSSHPTKIKPEMMESVLGSNGVAKNHTVSLSLTIHPTSMFLSSNNITHLSGHVWGHQLGLSGPAAQQPMNISFILPANLNHTKCVDNTTCDPITIQTCVSMEGTEDIFPGTTQIPEVCETPVLNASHHQSYIRGFQDYTFLKYYMCRQKTKIMVHYESQPMLTVMLSFHDRSLISLHLMHTSCFLFVMVVTMLFYAVVRTRPTSDVKYHTTSQSI